MSGHKRNHECIESDEGSDVIDLSGIAEASQLSTLDKNNKQPRNSSTAVSPAAPRNVICIDDDSASDRGAQENRGQNMSSDINIISEESDEDDNEIVPPLSVESFQYAGSAKTKITGIRYYHGTVNLNEHAYVRREPNNQYDVNAIQILNMNKQQVGHLTREVAAGLSSWLDNSIIKVEGSVAGKRGVYTIPLRLDVFAATSVMGSIKTALARAGIQLVNDRSKAKMLRDGTQPMMDTPFVEGTTSVVTSRQATAFLDELTVNERDLELMPHAKQPMRLETSLLPYQLQGLHWLLGKEDPRAPLGLGTVQLWRQHEGHGWFNIASHFSCTSVPTFGRGGLLADDMGLGKTVQMLALIVATKECAPSVYHDLGHGPTLVVCPRGLVSNWLGQAAEHVSTVLPLKCSQYHGSIKPSKHEIAGLDLVVTTYGTVAAEHSRSSTSGSLFKVNWKRIILDESHKVRNPKAQTTAAVNALNGKARWCLTVSFILVSELIIGHPSSQYLQRSGICGAVCWLDWWSRITGGLQFEDNSQTAKSRTSCSERGDQAYDDDDAGPLPAQAKRHDFQWP